MLLSVQASHSGQLLLSISSPGGFGSSNLIVSVRTCSSFQSVIVCSNDIRMRVVSVQTSMRSSTHYPTDESNTQITLVDFREPICSSHGGKPVGQNRKAERGLLQKPGSTYLVFRLGMQSNRFHQLNFEATNLAPNSS